MSQSVEQVARTILARRLGECEAIGSHWEANSMLLTQQLSQAQSELMLRPKAEEINALRRLLARVRDFFEDGHETLSSALAADVEREAWKEPDGPATP